MKGRVLRVQTKANYYRLLQAVRIGGDANDAWQEWVLYMLTAVETTAHKQFAR